MANDLLFTCTTQIVAEAIWFACRRRIWRYRYDAYFPNTRFFKITGAYHTAEIPWAWGTYSTPNQFPSMTPTQIALSRYMQGAWAQFAEDLSSGPGWPRLGSAFGVELGILGGGDAPSDEKMVALARSNIAYALYNLILITANLACQHCKIRGACNSCSRNGLVLLVASMIGTLEYCSLS
jgi:hypothetical protein